MADLTIITLSAMALAALCVVATVVLAHKASHYGVDGADRVTSLARHAFVSLRATSATDAAEGQARLDYQKEALREAAVAFDDRPKPDGEEAPPTPPPQTMTDTQGNRYDIENIDGREILTAPNQRKYEVMS